MKNEPDIEALLRLYSVPGIGGGRMRTLIKSFGSAENVIDAPLQKLIKIQGVEHRLAQKIKSNIDERFVQNQLTLMEKFKVEIISFWSKDYPALLKKIYDPPVFLFVKGKIIDADRVAIGVVGSRLATAYGKVITEQFTHELVEARFTVVSGLARGIDTIAHKQALRSTGRTIAVLGSGIDQIYPPENKKLALDIAGNGAVISEYPFGTKPDAGNFPRRNRIISGMSLGVLITEAGVKSGALITAFQALEQNREVFAVPGPINSGKSTGTNQLIKEGAKLVQGVNDIFVELAGQLNQNVIKSKRKIPALSGLELKVFQLLDHEPQHVDQIALKIKKSTAEILTVLLTLELLGVVNLIALHVPTQGGYQDLTIHNGSTS